MSEPIALAARTRKILETVLGQNEIVQATLAGVYDALQLEGNWVLTIVEARLEKTP